MAVANTKSVEITNLDAVPVKRNKSLTTFGRLRESVAALEILAADDAGSVYRLMRIHSGMRLSSLEIGHDAITGMTTADIGLYRTAEDGGAVVDVDLFASAVSLASAAALTDRTYEATATNIAQIDKAIWELLGLTEDPQVYYDVCVTATTNAPSAGGTLAGRMRFSVGD